VEDADPLRAGHWVTGHLDQVPTQPPVTPPLYELYDTRSYPHQVNFNNSLGYGPDTPWLQHHSTVLGTVDNQLLNFPLSPFINQLPPTPAASNQPFEYPESITRPHLPPTGTPDQSPSPPPHETAQEYTMQLNIITKVKAKRGKVGEGLKIEKAPTMVLLGLTYLEFLGQLVSGRPFALSYPCS
jgi:hypothetical protein